MLEILPQHIGTTGLVVLGLLLFLSIAITTICIFKIFQFMHLKVGNSSEAQIALEAWSSGKANAPAQPLSKSHVPTSKVAFAALKAQQHHPDQYPFAATQAKAIAIHELRHMKRHLRLLKSLITTALLLGLLGTSLGLMEWIMLIESEAGPTRISEMSGVNSALFLPCAVGLIIAIPSHLLANWLEGRVEREGETMTCLIYQAYRPNQ